MKKIVTEHSNELISKYFTSKNFSLRKIPSVPQIHEGMYKNYNKTLKKFFHQGLCAFIKSQDSDPFRPILDTFCDVRKARKKLVMFPIELEEIPFPFSSDKSKSVVDLKDRKSGSCDKNTDTTFFIYCLTECLRNQKNFFVLA